MGILLYTCANLKLMACRYNYEHIADPKCLGRGILESMQCSYKHTTSTEMFLEGCLNPTFNIM